MHPDDLNDMTDNMKDFFHSAKQESLTQSERALMRNEIQMFMSEHPATAPLSVRVLDAISDFFSSPVAPRTRMFAPAALAIVLVVGAGTSYAAENALPGSPLYAIKVNMLEPIRGALVTSASAKAEWNTERITKRLAEAEQLVAVGKLTPDARAEITAQINATSADFNESISVLAKEEGKGAEKIATAQSNLEASLAGHENVLASLGEDTPAIRENIMPILENVRSRRANAAFVRSHAEAAVSAKDNETVRTAALDTKEAAKDAVKEMKNRVKTARESGVASTSATTGESAHAEEAITIGDEKMKEGDYGTAFSTFQAAIRAAQTVKVDVDAQVQLKSVKTDEGTKSNNTGNSSLEDR